MNWTLWISFVIVETALCITPGPAVLFVLSHGLTRGLRASLAANAGILTSNAIYFLLSALGLGAVLLTSYDVFTLVKYAGAGYLLYLGVQTMRGAGLSVANAPPVAAETRARHIWIRAVALQLSNPKAVVFFAALLPQFLDTHRPLAIQIAVLAATSLAVEFVVLAGYGYLAGRASWLARQPRFVALTNRVSGSMLMAAGAGIALTRD